MPRLEMVKWRNSETAKQRNGELRNGELRSNHEHPKKINMIVSK